MFLLARRFCFAFFLLYCSALHAAPVPAETDVVILGAGLSGLTTAYELKKAGIPFHVLEITPRVGGRVRTVTYQWHGETITADSGMEEYWESNPAVKLLRELKLPLKGDVAASSMVLENKLQPYSGGTPQDYLKKLLGQDGYAGVKKIEAAALPVLGAVHAFYEKGEKLPESMLALKDLSFADWVKRQGVPSRTSEWVRVSVECEAGTEWTKISALDGIAEFHIFVGEGEKSFRVTGGNERFTDALAKAAGREHFSLNIRVNRMVTNTKKGGPVEVYYLDTEKNRVGVIRAKHVVSTIPLFRFFELQFEPPLSQKKQAAILSQGWGAYFKAHIFVSAAAEKFWKKNGETILPILSDSELGVIYDGDPRAKGKSRVLSLLITGAHAEKFNLTPLDYVRKEVSEKLEKLWPGIEKHVEGIEFYRYHPRAVASWPVGRSRFDELSEEIRKPENQIYLAGDFTETSHSDGAFLSAYRVVRQIRNSTAAARVETAAHGAAR